jgi:hypothetical protein
MDMLTTALAASPEGTALVPASRLATGPLVPHVLQLRAVVPVDRFGPRAGDVLGWQLHLPWETDPLPMNGRRNHFRTAAIVKQTRESAYLLARAYIPRQDRIRVELVQHVTDRKDRDPDNLSHTYKALVDGLRDDARLHQVGIVANDTPAYVDRLMPRIETHKPDGRQRDLPLRGWFRLHVWPAGV